MQAKVFTSKQFMLFAGVILFFCLSTEMAHASTTAGGGLPFESWLDKVKNSLTGPFAFVASVLGFVGSGTALIFGSDMNGFVKVLLSLVMAVSLVIAADGTLQAITGKGAEITHMTMAPKFGERHG